RSHNMQLHVLDASSRQPECAQSRHPDVKEEEDRVHPVRVPINDGGEEREEGEGECRHELEQSEQEADLLHDWNRRIRVRCLADGTVGLHGVR
ncbi:hypothetical protein PENTCL1PPCAC_845, partial [Pristionchus entomophagus]